MTELSLEWIEAGRLNTKKILPNLTSRQPEMLRIGRDSSRCDIVLVDGSVSGLHVEIGYDPAAQSFYIHNLRESNPPIVNGQPLPTGRISLQSENTIQLGNVQIRAIAILSAQANSFPETDIHLPQPDVPPTEVFTSQPAAAPVPSVSPPAASDAFPLPDVGSASVQANSARPTSKSFIWILAGCGLMLGLFLLALPNISGFLGISRGSVISDPSTSGSGPAGDSTVPQVPQFTAEEIEPYAHPSGLFGLVVPQDWEFLDNSQPGEMVIQGWHHPLVNSYAIVRIFDAMEPLSQEQLEAFGEETVEALFGELDDFQRGDPVLQSDDSVRVAWQAQDGPDTLLAYTFVRQDGLYLSVLSIWLPDNTSNFEEWLDELEIIVASYSPNPDINIP